MSNDHSETKRRGWISSSLGATGWPVFWGLASWVGFYALLKQGVIRNDLIDRYFTGHPIEYAESALFFVGIAVLVGKLFDVARQYRSLEKKVLEPIPDGGQPVDEAPDLLQELSEAEASVRKTHLATRILDILESIRRTGSADHVDEELKYLAESDANRTYDSYALVRIIVWATPMLGFLGTVIGITLALGNLSPEALVNTPEQAMEGLLGGLAIAFDTTALAITLAIILMFAQYQVTQFETQLLNEVDRRAAEEMIGRFQTFGGADDPTVAVVRRMAEENSRSSRLIMEQQAELWRSTIDAAHQQWSHLADSSGEHLKRSLAEALKESLHEHAQTLSASSETTAEQSRQLWEQLQGALVENARIVEKQQQEMVRQSEALMRIVETSGDITSMEHALNENLRALAGANHFEETVLSLSAAINLMSAKLRHDPSSSQDRAA